MLSISIIGWIGIKKVWVYYDLLLRYGILYVSWPYIRCSIIEWKVLRVLNRLHQKIRSSFLCSSAAIKYTSARRKTTALSWWF